MWTKKGDFKTAQNPARTKGAPPPSRPWGRATPEYSLLGWTNSHAELFCSFPNSWCSALRKLQQDCPCVRQAIVVRGSPFSNVLEGCEVWQKCRVTCNWRSCNSRCGFVSAQIVGPDATDAHKCVNGRKIWTTMWTLFFFSIWIHLRAFGAARE